MRLAAMFSSTTFAGNSQALRGLHTAAKDKELSTLQKIKRATSGKVAKKFAPIGLHAPEDTMWREKLLHSLDLVLKNKKVKQDCHDPDGHWLQDQLNDIVDTLGHDAAEEAFDLLFDEEGPEISSWAWLYKYYIDQNEQGEYIGTFGQHTRELKDRHRMTEEFWEMTDKNDRLVTDDVLLMGFHGADLEDPRNMRRLIPILYSHFSRTEVYELDEWVRDFIGSLPRGFDNPLLAYNAFAFDGAAFTEEINDGTVYPDAVLMGDGILEKLEDLGFAQDGPDFVHAHEFGHQMQYEADIDHTGTLSDSIKEGRRIELMADALSAFFLAHPSGGNLCQERLEELDDVAFSFGDCKVDEDGHHGTPQQRQCAANWGASLGLLDAHEQLALSPRMVRDRFVAALDAIVAGDSSVCSFTVPDGMTPVSC